MHEGCHWAIVPGPTTTAVHAGEVRDPRSGAINTPIQQSSTFVFPERPDGSASDHIYTRYANPTIQAVETKLAALEGADHALLFSSGMAATQTLCTALLSTGDTLAYQEGIYGGTVAYLAEELQRFGIKTVPVTMDENGAPGSLPEGVRIVWAESITNPLLRVCDLEAWAEAAHEAGALFVVDATFASPILQRPLGMGVDLVMHSASKYLGGHSDLIAGVLAFDVSHHDVLWRARRNLGGTMDPSAAALLGRSIKTLTLRVERATRNAEAVAQYLAQHDKVVSVHHPSLPGHPDHLVAKRMLPDGAGGVVTFDVGSADAARSFRRAIQLITPAASLGGVESLASLPMETSHAYAPVEDRRAAGITDGLVRLSVGIEDVEDILADLDQALGKL